MTRAALRYAHARRLPMQATFQQLQAMEAKLYARLSAGRMASRRLLAVGGLTAETMAARIEVRSSQPLERQLELVRDALRVAAERSINSRAVAERAARRGKARRTVLTHEEQLAASRLGRAIFRASHERTSW